MRWLLLLGAACLLGTALAQQRKYTTKYDNIDIDAVIRNERLLNSYVGCLLDRGACTPDAAELKSTLLPTALRLSETSCWYTVVNPGSSLDGGEDPPLYRDDF